MKRLLLATIMAVVSSSPTSAGLNVWTTAGPPGASIFFGGLATDPQTIGVVYVATLAGFRGRLFKSTTGATIWVPINNGLGDESVVGLAVDPQTPAIVYAGTLNSGVFKSTNGGATWTASNTGLTPLLGLTSLSVGALAIDPQTPTTLYAAIIGGIFKSTNGGSTWTAGPPPTANSGALVLVIDPVNTSTLYAISGRVFKSTNAGGSWSLSSSGLPDGIMRTVVIDPRTPSTLYAAMDNYGVFKSTDGGANWNRTNLSGTVYGLAIDPQASATLYAAGPSGVWKTMNGGATWGVTGLATRHIAMAIALEPRRPQRLYIGLQNGGVMKSTDGGATWSEGNVALSAQAVQAVDVARTIPATAYAVSGGGESAACGGALFKTVNGGASWNPVALETGRFFCTVAVDPQTPSNVYAGAYDGALKSTDGGISWTSLALPGAANSVGALVIDPRSPSIVYAGNLNSSVPGVFKSTDGGAHWTPTELGGVERLFIDPQTTSTVYATASSGVFKSTNGGASWVDTGPRARAGGSLAGAKSLAIDPKDPRILYVGIDQTTFGGVFTSTNGGATWTATNTGLTNVNVRALAVDPQAPTTVYAGTIGGIFRSTNSGATWIPFNTGLSNIRILALAVNPAGTCLHVGTEGSGVFTFATRFDSSCLPPPPLVAALSTTSQFGAVGTATRTFATVENLSGTASDAGPDGVAAERCGVTQLTGAPTPFTFQTVDPATDQPVAPLNTPIDIAPTTSRKFLITLTPSAPMCPTNIQFGFNCGNTSLADILTGQNTLLLSAGPTAGCGLSASVSASQATFVAGQTLIAGGSVTNSGLPGVAADFYVGLLRPDRSIRFITPAGLVVGNVSDLRSFRPLAVNQPLTTPFSVSQSSVFTHQWTADDLRGNYVFFVLAVKAGALAGGTLAADQILRVATAPFAF